MERKARTTSQTAANGALHARAVSVAVPRSSVALTVLGALVGALMSGVLIDAVNAAAWQGPPTGAPPANNLPGVIWNAADAGALQTNAAINIDGTLMLGSPGTTVAASENLIYGNVTSTSAGSLALLQAGSADRFRVTATGNVTASGNIVAGGSIKSNGCFGPTFVGATPGNHHGSLGIVGGYYAANSRCAAAFPAGNGLPAAHVCEPEEILESIRCSIPGDPIRVNGGLVAWLSGGPPGHTSDANDCVGWTRNSWAGAEAPKYGRIWQFNNTTGGHGSMTTCNVSGGLRFACCR